MTTEIISCLKYDALTALAVKFAALWDMITCSMLDCYHICGGLCHILLVLP